MIVKYRHITWGKGHVGAICVLFSKQTSQQNTFICLNHSPQSLPSTEVRDTCNGIRKRRLFPLVRKHFQLLGKGFCLTKASLLFVLPRDNLPVLFRCTHTSLSFLTRSTLVERSPQFSADPSSSSRGGAPP